MTRNTDGRLPRDRGRRRLLGAAVLALSGLLVLISGATAESASSWSAELGDPAPALSLSDLDGKPVALKDFEHQVVLVNLWATYCLPCRHEMPLLDELAEANRDRGLVVLGISIDRKRAENRVRELVEELDLSYPILLDPEEKATGLFPAPALPASFLFDRRGRLAWQRLGVIVEDDLEFQEALREALRSDPPPPGEQTGW